MHCTSVPDRNNKPAGNNASTAAPANNLTRSRRSNFTRTTTDPNYNNASAAASTTASTATNTTNTNNKRPATLTASKSVDEGSSLGRVGRGSEKARILYEYEHLLAYSKSAHSWALPKDWATISQLGIVRNKVNYDTRTDEPERLMAHTYSWAMLPCIPNNNSSNRNGGFYSNSKLHRYYSFDDVKNTNKILTSGLSKIRNPLIHSHSLEE